MPNRFEKIALFIDGAHFYAVSKGLGFKVDFKRLLSALNSDKALIRAFYCTAFVEEDEFISIRPLLDGLTLMATPSSQSWKKYL